MPLDLDILNPCDRCMRKGETPCAHEELVNNVALLVAAIHFYFLSWFFNWKLGALVFFAMMYMFAWQIFINIRDLNEEFHRRAEETESDREEEESETEVEDELSTESEREEGEIPEDQRSRVIYATYAALEPSESDSDEMPELIPTTEAWPRRRNPNYLEEVD